MYQTIKDLWRGNIAPCDHCGSHDTQLNHLVWLMERNREELDKISTTQQKEILEKFIDCANEYNLLMMEEAFCEGFCLGIRLAAGALI